MKNLKRKFERAKYQTAKEIKRITNYAKANSR